MSLLTAFPPVPAQNPAAAPGSPRLVLWAKLTGLGVLAYLAASPFFFHVLGATIARSGKPSHLPLGAVVALQGVQTSLFVALAAWAFVALGPRLGLDAPVLRGARRLREVLVPGIVAGTAATLALVAIERGFRPFMPAELHKAGADGAMGANLAAALLFGVGHLDAVKALGIPFTPVLVTYIVLGNAVGGIVFGWLYARRGIEAAMVAHFTGDLWLHVVLRSLLS